MSDRHPVSTADDALTGQSVLPLQHLAEAIMIVIPALFDSDDCRVAGRTHSERSEIGAVEKQSPLARMSAAILGLCAAAEPQRSA